MILPHRFPFRIVDRAGERSAALRLSAGDWWLRGAARSPIGLLVEAAAQASALLLAPDGAGEPSSLYLAGIEDATIDELPAAGETIEIEARIEARLGRVTRVAARLLASGREAGRATLLLATGDGGS